LFPARALGADRACAAPSACSPAMALGGKKEDKHAEYTEADDAVGQEDQ
jgi:hypothetical protein